MFHENTYSNTRVHNYRCRNYLVAFLSSHIIGRLIKQVQGSSNQKGLGENEANET